MEVPSSVSKIDFNIYTADSRTGVATNTVLVSKDYTEAENIIFFHSTFGYETLGGGSRLLKMISHN